MIPLVGHCSETRLVERHYLELFMTRQTPPDNESYT